MAGGSDDGPGASGTDAGESARTRRYLPAPVRRRYAAKFLSLLLLVVLVVAGVGGFSYYQIQAITQEDAESTLRSTATLQADSVSEWVAGMRVQALAAASTDAFATEDPARIRAYLRESSSLASSDVVAMHYVDPATGRIVASTDRGIEGERVGQVSAGIRQPVAALSGNGSEPRVGTSQSAYERNGNLRMAFASRVRTGDGVVVVVGDVRRDFEQLHETRSVVTTRVLDARGKGVMAPRRNNPSGLADTPEFRTALAGNTTTLHRDAEVVAFAPVPGTEWVVSTTAPKGALYRASDAVGRNVIGLVAASIVTLGAVGVVLWRQTVPPLVRLRRRAEAMEDGDLDVDLSSTREDEIGRLYRSFASMRDALREQIRAANEARDAAERSREELERQNERLDQFASTVSHDLRSPLTVARGNLELVATTLAETDPDGDGDHAAVRERVEAVEAAHERIETIIEDVLALARHGETLESTAPVDLGTVAREAWSTVDTRDATLTIPETRTVEADRDRLRRALENLFGNAIEHAGPAASVTVETTETGFAVTDDGSGVPADVAEEVFEYGYSSSEAGLGLGLSIVETIASAHDWTLSVDGDYDAGARFVFDDVFEPDSPD